MAAGSVVLALPFQDNLADLLALLVHGGELRSSSLQLNTRVLELVHESSSHLVQVVAPVWIDWRYRIYRNWLLGTTCDVNNAVFNSVIFDRGQKGTLSVGIIYYAKKRLSWA